MSDDRDELVAASYAVRSFNSKRLKVRKAKPLDDTWLAHKKHDDFLQENYKQLNSIVFEKFAGEVCQRIRELYTGVADKKKKIYYIPCALITMVDIDDVMNLIEFIVTNFENQIRFIVRVSSDRFKSLHCFVNLLQDTMEKLDTKYERPDFSTYSLFAKNDYAACSRLKSHSDDFPEPCLVIFEDFEAMNSNVLSDLVRLMHDSFYDMPIILICCQAMDIVSINFKLSQRALDCLKIEPFNIILPSETGHQLINYDNLEFPFFIGPKVARLIVNHYLLWETSLTSLLKHYRLCLLHHYHSNSLAKFCQDINNLKCFDPIINSLDTHEIDLIRSLPSVKGCIDFPKNIKDFPDFFYRALNEYLIDYKRACDELKTYHAMKKVIFNNPKLSFYRDTWSAYLESGGNFTKSKDFIHLKQKLKEQDIDSLTKMCEAISRIDSTIGSRVCDIFAKFQANINQMEVDSTPKKLPSPSKQPLTPNLRPRRATSCSLSRGLSQLNAVKKTPKLKNPFAEIKNEILKVIEQIIEEECVNPLIRPFHEIFFFDDTEVIKKEILPTTRENILSQLSDFRSFLNIGDSYKVPAKPPAMVILYRLILDLPGNFSFNELYQKFVNFVRDQNMSPCKRTRKISSKDEIVLKMRFTDALRDLDYIGFIQAHPRKKGFVERLVWPNCKEEVDYKIDEEKEEIADYLGNKLSFDSPQRLLESPKQTVRRSPRKPVRRNLQGDY